MYTDTTDFFPPSTSGRLTVFAESTIRTLTRAVICVLGLFTAVIVPVIKSSEKRNDMLQVCRSVHPGDSVDEVTERFALFQPSVQERPPTNSVPEYETSFVIHGAFNRSTCRVFYGPDRVITRSDGWISVL